MGSYRKTSRILLIILFITIIGVSTSFGPSRFLPFVRPVSAITCPTGGLANGCLTVSLDANSRPTSTSTTTCAVPLGQKGVCDTTINPTASNTTTFRVGAVLNATSINKATSSTTCGGTGQILCGVFGWQFGIRYDPTIVTPSGDPSKLCTTYPDCADSTVWYGSQTGTGTVNWASYTTTQAARLQSISENNTTAEILVGFSFLNPTPPVVISARNVLASVAFELVRNATATFTVDDVLFVDANSAIIPGIIAADTASCAATSCGSPRVLVTNDPPHANFNVTKISPFAFRFDASSSWDADGAVTGPGGYFWDFGDGTQELGTSGVVLTHDYNSTCAPVVCPNGNPFPGTFQVSLRVADNLGATGTARTDSGQVLLNRQPSHTNQTIVLTQPVQPDFVLSATPPNLAMNAGTNSLFSLTLGSQNDFSGTITLSSYFSQFPFANNSLSILPTLTVNPASVALTPGAIALAFLYVSTISDTSLGPYTISVNATSGSTRHLTTVQLTVQRPSDLPPIASFTYSPINGTTRDQIAFDASASHDPDGYIQGYTWEFGDGGIFFYSYPSAYHYYNAPGTYTVRLTVTDNAGLSASVTKLVQIVASPMHDVGISGIYVSPTVAVQTQQVGVSVVAFNRGQQIENVTVSVYYDHHVLGTQSGIFLYPSPYYEYLFFAWDTSNVLPGNYTISATIFLPNDENPSNNNFTSPYPVTILPAPTLSLNPPNGVEGTELALAGSGFPQGFSFSGIGQEYWVTFDDMFVGFGFMNNGQANFTFNVPHAQLGTHTVKVLDLYTGARASAVFTVLPPPSPQESLDISVDTGAVYFPGDVQVSYVRITLNGNPVGKTGFHLQVSLIKPDGSKIGLTATLIAPGLYRTSYTVPTTGSLGTYALTVNANLDSGENGSSLASFEAKPSWIQAHGTTLTLTTASVGALSILGLAFWKGDLWNRIRTPKTQAKKDSNRKEAGT